MTRFFLFLVLLTGFACPTVMAQEEKTPTESVSRLEKLRAQLRETMAQEMDWKERVRQLEVALAPENLERAFAQTPSLNPAELRENRRRQLESEKAKAEQQLSSLAESRINLENAILLLEGKLNSLREPAVARSEATPPSQTAQNEKPSEKNNGNKASAKGRAVKKKKAHHFRRRTLP